MYTAQSAASNMLEVTVWFPLFAPVGQGYRSALVYVQSMLQSVCASVHVGKADPCLRHSISLCLHKINTVTAMHTVVERRQLNVQMIFQYADITARKVCAFVCERVCSA